MRLLAALGSFAEAPPPVERLHAEAVEPDATVERALSPSQEPAPVRADGTGGAPPPGFHVSLPGAPVRTDVLQEREQVRALLAQVRRWVEHHEPSSPATILLKQADRMWGRRFSEVAYMIPPDLMRAWDQDD